MADDNSISPAEAAARAFYSNTDYSQAMPTTSASTVLTQAPTAAEEAAAKLFPSMQQTEPLAYNDSTPAHIRELREGDADRKMFSASMMSSALPDSAFDNVVGQLPDGTPILAAHRQSAAREIREIAVDLSLSGQALQDLAGIYTQNTATPPTEQQIATWRDQSVKALTEKYGAEADYVLGLASKLVERDARVGQLLMHGKLGNHPRAVTALVEAALREASKGRLK